MGRSVRRVPKDWQHPKIERFNYLKAAFEWNYQPMHDRPFAPVMREWYAGWEAWERGERQATCDTYFDWAGPPPNPAYYRPDWPESERTHLMMYEDTSEGTPISPAFETAEELACWLVENNASAFGKETGTYEGWLAVAKGAWAMSMIVENGVAKNGVDFAAAKGE